jgi:hypothetical protein
MRYIVPIGIVAILLLSVIGAATSHNGQKTVVILEQEKSCSIVFSTQPTITTRNNYLEVTFDQATSYTTTPGLPILPILVKNFQVPATATHINVLCTASNTEQILLSGKIRPAAPYVIQGVEDARKSMTSENKQVYGSIGFYPSSLYTYRVTCGRNDNNHIVNFVDVAVYPFHYSPAGNVLSYLVGSVEIKVTYDLPPQEARNLPESYDLVIIAPQEFAVALQPLADHKNNIGVRTILKPVEDIYTEYQGHDKPEQIKNFIADAYAKWNISSVLLVGGLKSHLFAIDREGINTGSQAWWIPVRYTSIYLYEKYTPKANVTEPGCITDLYYADLFKAGQVFDTWDSNNNGIFAEAKVDMAGYSKINDTLDLRPDVYVSRLPCTTPLEVKIIVRKIITYEKTNASQKPWYNTMIAIAGKTSHLYLGGQPDGEYITDTAITDMGGIVTNPVRLYVSNNATGGPRPIPTDIIPAIQKGAGYIDFEGHGNPLRWDTIWADGEWPYNWAGGLRLADFIKLTNGHKLPIVVIGGCHNGLFNVSLLQTFRDIWFLLNKTRYWTGGAPAPLCFAWGLCLVPYGGSIASIAGTGLGIGPGQGTPLEYSAALEGNFFHAIGQENAHTFGEAHGDAVNRYITTHPILDGMDYHCISIFQPFGDPSLKLGGG